LRLLSNYGHPGAISCSAIEALDHRQFALPIASCTIGRFPSPELEKLIDGHLIKTHDYQLWEHQWPAREKTFDLVLTIASPEPVSFLKIWPNQITDSKSIKDLTVSVGGAEPFEYQLDAYVSTTIPISDPVEPSDIGERLAAMHLAESGRRIVDGHGEYPLLRFTKLEFVALDTYSRKKQFGLRQIRLFDLQGKLIVLSEEVCEVTVVGCGTCGNLDWLIETGKCKDENRGNVWVGQFAAQRPKIVLTFKDPTAISGIVIENGEFFRNDEVACKSMQILADGNSVWVGKVNRRAMGSRDTSGNLTFVFLLWQDQLQEKIRQAVHRLEELVRY
jgi:hypothetical protein